MTPIEQLERILPAMNAAVDRIEPVQLDHPTPCSHFTVRDILDHILVVGGTYAYVFRGEEPPEIAPSPDDGRVPAPLVRKTLADLLDAVRSPGALERTLDTPMGPLPGETFARLVAFDGLIHGWDLCRATGQPYQPDEDVVAAVDEFARAAIKDEMRDGDTFKAQTTAPAGATRLEQLVAFSGRTL